MYELILKWGLDTLSKFTQDKAGKDFTLIVEAIKTKNSLIIEKRYSWSACQAIVDLSLSVDQELDDFYENTIKTAGTRESAYKYMGQLKTQFHPKFYRKLKKLRSQFDCTSDLFSAYSSTFTDILHFNTLQSIVDTQHRYSASEINWTYRGLWIFYSEIITKLIRITSTDLRFWLTDNPYIQYARIIAQSDLENANNYLHADKWDEKYFYLSLEKKMSWQNFGVILIT